ncbi:MAG: membrane protein insertase YidC, partial [Bryobacteraceae bacterium]
MPDSDNGKPAPPRKPNEVSMEQRLLLAFILMGAVLFATQYFYKPSEPQTLKQEPPKPEQQAVKPAPPTPQGKVEQSAEQPEQSAEQPATSQLAAAEEQKFTIETNLYKIVLSNRGAVLESWILKKYQDAAGKPLELVNPAAAPKVPKPLAISFSGQKPPADLNQAMFVGRQTEDGLG